MRYLHAYLVLIPTVFLLMSCTVLDQPVLYTLKHALPGPSKGPDPTVFDPNFRYLRITMHDRSVMLVALPSPVGQPSNWYSSLGEVLRLCNGRLCGATGLTTEWRGVIMPALPRWSALAAIQGTYTWQRHRDLMPGYHFGIIDNLSLHSIPVPHSSDMVGVNPSTLHWFEEIDLSHDETLPPTYYAVDLSQQQVVYSHTCLSSSLCFSWQRWPTHPGQ